MFEPLGVSLVNADADDSLEGAPLAGSRYRALASLGRGGTADVYEAEHIDLGKIVAVKVLRSEFVNDAQLVARLRLDGRSLGALDHPNIVAVMDSGETSDGRRFIVMERLWGHTLKRELALRGPFKPRDAIAVLRQLLSALCAAHGIGIVHRDIKPDNLFLHEPNGIVGGEPVLKVLDFNFAKVVRGVSERSPAPLTISTDQNEIVGTPRYLSPEAARGLHVDHRSDLYPAGIVLYELLVGHDPFSDIETVGELIRAHARLLPAPPSYSSPHPIPARLDAAVLKMLEKDPAKRFQSAAECVAELEAIDLELRAAEDLSPAMHDGNLAGSTQPAPPEAFEPGSKSESSIRPRLAPSLVMVLVVLVTAVVVVLLGLWLFPARTAP